jgi:hypothetical protein
MIVFMRLGDICRIIDILLIMLLHPDTARISVQKLHPIAHREYFLSRQVNSMDHVQMHSNYQQQESTISNDTDDMSVGDINEITFSMLIDDGVNDEYAGEDDAADEDDDDDDNDDDTYDDDDAEQDESDDEKRVSLLSMCTSHCQFNDVDRLYAYACLECCVSSCFSIVFERC